MILRGWYHIYSIQWRCERWQWVFFPKPHASPFFEIYLFYFWLPWVFITVSGLFAICGERGLFSGCGTRASHYDGFCQCRAWAVCSRSCGTWAQLLRGMWDLPGPGIELIFPVLAGEFLTTRPPGTPTTCFLKEKLGLCQGSLSLEQVVRLTTRLFSPRQLTPVNLLHYIHNNIPESHSPVVHYLDAYISLLPPT